MDARRKAYEAKAEAQLAEYNAQMALLKAKAAKAKSDVKADHLKSIEALQKKQNTANEKLLELKGADDSGWEDLKTGAEKVWEDVKSSFRTTTAKMGQ